MRRWNHPRKRSSYVAQERASVLRERLLRIPDDVPAHKTAKAWVQPRLKSRTHESWKRNNDHEPDDTLRTHRGCWRRTATEIDCIAELDSSPPPNRLVAKLLLGHCTNRRPSSPLTWQTETSRRRSATPKSPSPMTYWIPLPRMT